MTDEKQSPPGSFAATELRQLQKSLEASYEQRLQDLQAMLDFNRDAEARNPQLRWIAKQLRP